jgi:Domain of unknown function (DUF4288)
MNWYLVKMVFQIICGDGKHTAQFEEQIRLVKADDASAALTKATLLGKQEEQAFFNHAQQTVCWKLIAVTDIYPFSEELDGAEIFSRISEEEQADAFIHTMQMRSTDVTERITGIFQS